MSSKNITEVIYLKRDNLVSLEFRKDGVVQDLSSIDRVRLILTPNLELDYDVDNLIFDWTTTSTQLDIDAGNQDIPEGVYQGCQLVFYDTTHTNGVVWGTIDVIVNDGIFT